MSAKPDPAAPGLDRTERRRLILNEKCKAQSGFCYNLGVAIITAGPVANLISQAPTLHPPVIVLSCAFGMIFYLLGNNRLDQMVE
ncbi:hypothetical protein GU927_006210 [Rhodobacteraceae bacterium HSP-20]|uniref:Amino acid transporter n=1 Tax=Paragemmobacter amnigenus TaxID=2852097 RepID=A0ABS6J4Q4_9RHOB|nr:hypothetical protein [Rhodobacter amnigenus]MBU9697437.1 hypothetical protein [Rhodobacter amnigenus]MBV4388664.1 hypothetical protein [Rhodobacter amnigenus]